MATDELEGVVTIDGDRATLTFERRLRHPVERVWAAITEPAHRDIWMGKSVIDGREGGSIETVASGPPVPPDMKRMTGRILVWDPPHVFEHEWHQQIVEPGVVRYELTADGTGTLLRMTHRGLGGAQRQRIPARHTGFPRPSAGAARRHSPTGWLKDTLRRDRRPQPSRHPTHSSTRLRRN